MSEKNKIKHINVSFVCENCQQHVPPIIGGGCRNHCPYCLVSKHVDELPGDRDCMCHGLMDPIDIIYNSKKGYVIVHKCRKCNIIKNNKATLESKDINDSMDEILKLVKSKIF